MTQTFCLSCTVKRFHDAPYISRDLANFCNVQAAGGLLTRDFSDHSSECGGRSDAPYGAGPSRPTRSRITAVFKPPVFHDHAVGRYAIVSPDFSMVAQTLKLHYSDMYC